jgi:hypothetical protein
MMCQVAAVSFCFVDDIIAELVFFKDAGIFGKQAEEQAYQVNLQRVAGIADLLQPVVEFAHQFGSFDIYRVLFAEFMFLVPGNEAEVLYIFVQVGQEKLKMGAGIQVVQPEPGKIRDENILWKLKILQSREIIKRLFVGLVKVFPL